MLKRLRPSAYELLEWKGRRLEYLCDPPLGMLAYAISPAAAASLSSASANLFAPIDKFVQRTREHRTPIFSLTPAIVRHANLASSSTIGSRSRKSRNLLLLASRLIYKAIGETRRLRFDERQLRRLGVTARH